jgi:hypothetical protein
VSAFQPGDRVRLNAGLSPLELADLSLHGGDEFGLVTSVDVGAVETRIAVRWDPDAVVSGYYEAELERLDLPADRSLEAVERWLAS